jgi:hypothetical protein
MKSICQQPFNRYAWNVERQFSKSDMKYHGDHITILGHIFSMLARLFLGTHDETDQTFFKDHIDAIAETAKRLSTPGSGVCQFETVEEAENYLKFDDASFAHQLVKIIRPVMKDVKKELDSGENQDLLTRAGKCRAETRARREKAQVPKVEDLENELAEFEEFEMDFEDEEEAMDDECDDEDEDGTDDGAGDGAGGGGGGG